MLDKYFGFIKLQDEFSVIESFIEHSRIDEEEIELLADMVGLLCSNSLDQIEDQYLKIRKINTDSSRIYETIAEQIINANFDHQKQASLLRQFRLIEGVSSYIISSAKRILILFRIGGHLPSELHEDVTILMADVRKIHAKFKEALEKFLDHKKDVIEIVFAIEELEHQIDHQRSICLEILYKLGNGGQMQLGNFRAIENIVEHLEDISDAIELAATNLEWMLIY